MSVAAVRTQGARFLAWDSPGRQVCWHCEQAEGCYTQTDLSWLFSGKDGPSMSMGWRLHFHLTALQKSLLCILSFWFNMPYIKINESEIKLFPQLGWCPVISPYLSLLLSPLVPLEVQRFRKAPFLYAENLFWVWICSECGSLWGNTVYCPSLLSRVCLIQQMSFYIIILPWESSHNCAKEAGPSLSRTNKRHQQNSEFKRCESQVCRVFFETNTATIVATIADSIYEDHVWALANVLPFFSVSPFSDGSIIVFPCTMTIRLASWLCHDPVFFLHGHNTVSSMLFPVRQNSVWSLLCDCRNHNEIR